MEPRKELSPQNNAEFMCDKYSLEEPLPFLHQQLVFFPHVLCRKKADTALDVLRLDDMSVRKTTFWGVRLNKQITNYPNKIETILTISMS